MSFLRHGQIYQPMSLRIKNGGETILGSPSSSHRIDEFATGYSSAGCTPAEPASASPAGFIFTQRLETVNRHHHKVEEFSSSIMRNFQPVLTQIRSRSVCGEITNLKQGMRAGPCSPSNDQKVSSYMSADTLLKPIDRSGARTPKRPLFLDSVIHFPTMLLTARRC